MRLFSLIRLTYSPALAFVVIGMFWGSFAAFVPVTKARIGANDAEFGLLLLGTSIGLGSTILLAPWLDRKLGKHALPLSVIALACVFLLPHTVEAQFAFFLTMVLAGLMSGMTDVLMNARVSEIEAKTKRSLMNFNHGMFSLAYAISALATGFVREADVHPFDMFLGLALLAALFSFFMHKKIPASAADGENQGGSSPVNIVLICGGIVLIAFMIEAAVESWSAIHIERTLGGGAAEGAFGPAMLGLTMAFGRFGGQAISSRFTEEKIILYATLMCFLGIVTVAAAQTPIWAYLGFATLGLGVSVIGPMGLALAGKLVPEAYRTAAISRIAVIGFAGFFFAPMAMGVISQLSNLRVSFASLAFIALFIVPLLRRVHQLREK